MFSETVALQCTCKLFLFLSGEEYVEIPHTNIWKYALQGGINTSVPLGGIYVKSIIPRGPADKDGQIKIGKKSGNETLGCRIRCLCEILATG